MSRLCRLKNKTHGEDGQWAYKMITTLQALLKEKDAEIERLTGVIALDCKIMEESVDKLKAAEQKIVEKDMEISKLKEGILLLREQLTNPRR